MNKFSYADVPLELPFISIIKIYLANNSPKKVNVAGKQTYISHPYSNPSALQLQLLIGGSEQVISEDEYRIESFRIDSAWENLRT